MVRIKERLKIEKEDEEKIVSKIEREKKKDVCNIKKRKKEWQNRSEMEGSRERKFKRKENT